MFQPGEVDPQRFCRNAQVWETESSISAFPRLAREFTQGQLSCRVAGEMDMQRRPVLHIAIQGEMVLTCQRCMGDLLHGIEVNRQLYLARDEAELERLEEALGLDGEVILAGGKLNLVELVEDEVLLGLPLVPKHELGECSGPVS
ncbi:MAG: DUF177 domain-containing protein [Thiobacillaceae bacterium]|jgi:uncharacterized protein|nr:DUF177 domain-containing protein [Thiobacillaceae bacterium]